MDDDELLTRVRELRERGTTPKQIARVLGLRPAVVAVLVRRVAEDKRANIGQAGHALLGCWISPGWSAGLGVDDTSPWAPLRSGEDEEPGAGGLVAVLIARQDRIGRAVVCGFLVDLYCLGVKNVVGPKRMSDGEVHAYRRMFFGGFTAQPSPAPLDLAQHLVHGAVAYARALGFEPHADFAEAAAYLGEGQPPTAPVRFGRDGAPYYVAGPYDDSRAVLATLASTVEAGNCN